VASELWRWARGVFGNRGILRLVVALAALTAPAAASATTDQFGAAPGAQYTFSSSAGTPNLLATGDFNGDGVPDLAVGTYNPSSDGQAGEVSILLGSVSEVPQTHGLPKEVFSGFTSAPGSPIAVGTAPSAVVTGDFNGDGKTDVAVLGSMGAGLTIYLGNGNGGFTVAPGSPIYVTGTLAVGKFTTGKPDEIAVVSGDTISVIGENASNTFTTLKTSTVSIPNAQYDGAVTAGAFGSNANIDLAVLDGSTGNVEMLLGGGGGGFSLSHASPISSGLNGPGCSGSLCLYSATSITTGNFNGDAHPDLAIGTADGKVAVLLGAGSATGTFTVAPGSPYVADPSGDEIAELVAAPFGSTAEDGIATANYFQGGCDEPCSIPADSVSVMLPNANGSLTSAAGSPYLDGGVTNGVAAGDFNQDGLADLAFLDANDCAGNAVGVLLNFGSAGTTPSPALYPADRCQIPTPTVTTGRPTAQSLTGATLNGTIDPNYQKVTGCKFVYGLGSGKVPLANSVPCTFPVKAGDESVSAKLTGLKSLSPYQFQLVATYTEGTATYTAAGAIQTFQTCDYPEIDFNSGLVATGCFVQGKNSSYSSTGNADVSGIEFEPAHGGITLDKNGQTLSVHGAGLMMVGGFIPVPWAGSLNINLSSTFTILPHVNFPLAGFRIEGQLTGSVLPGGELQLMAQTSMNILGNPVQASAGIITYNDTTDNKAELTGAAVGIGPASADPLDPSTLMYCNPKFKEQPQGFDCNPYPAGSKNPVYRLSPKGQNPENQTEIDPNNMPYCSISTPAPIGYKCEMVEDKNSRLGSSPRLIALNPGVVKLAGFLPLEGLGFSYDSGGGTWMGSATIDLNGLFPGSGKFSANGNTTLQVNLTIGTNPFQFDSGGFALNGAVALTPAGDDGPQLTNASFNLMLHPSFSIGGSLGVVIKSGASISGGFNLSLGNNSGFDLSVNGNVTTAAGIGWSGNAQFDNEDGGLAGELGGSLTRSFGPVSVTVGLDGSMEFEPQFHFQLKVDGTASVWGLTAGVHGVFSDAGIGLCGTANVFIGNVSVGFTWTHQSGFNWSSGCDFSGLYTVKFSTAPDAAHAAAVSQAIDVAQGTSREEFAAVGADGPPAVTLTGPGGATLSTPATENKIAVTSSGLALGVSDTDTTFFVVEHPAAGSWQMAPEAGQPAPVRYEVADPLVPLDLKASVTGKGRHRRLNWRLHAQRGQSVEFLQLGGTGEPITITTRGRGHTPFTIAPGPGGERQVIAIVSIDGIPQQRLTVARFRAPTPHGPAVSHAGYQLSGDTIKVSWRRAGGVAHYELDVTLRKGMLQYIYTAKSSHATLMTAPGAKVRRVMITATGTNGVTGKAVAAKLKQSKHRKRRHKHHR